ncbi:MAG: dihydroorotate dehydrogenase-like protein [Thermoanaerobaculia bacterium]|nr:dihydroorotate dehydrogenase-like protein [Thermoanaerobaculia bacterium]MCZ7649699.1 dihydroorotate dehydrogenase-like protein [Thermoanaerobaculia bacterium]
MDLRTTYLGLELAHPLMPGASPMADDLDTVRRLEDAGASAIVLHSLFEEQLAGEQLATHAALEASTESYAESLSFLPSPSDFRLGPEEYLEQIRKIKQAVKVPVIASLNGTSLGGWLAYARMMEEAGADALELNIYQLATDPEESGQMIERRTVSMVRAVTSAVMIPVAVKLSPYYTSVSSLATQLDDAGVDGLVLFNRFYQPDIDVEELEVKTHLRLSDSSELLLRLRWLAILAGRVKASLAVTGGVHSAIDVVKSVMSGAHAVQLVSALLRHGPYYLKFILDDLVRWLEEHEVDSLDEIRGNMSLERCPDPRQLERTNYMRVLGSWRPAW